MCIAEDDKAFYALLNDEDVQMGDLSTDSYACPEQETKIKY